MCLYKLRASSPAAPARLGQALCAIVRQTCAFRWWWNLCHVLLNCCHIIFHNCLNHVDKCEFSSCFSIRILFFHLLGSFEQNFLCVLLLNPLLVLCLESRRGTSLGSELRIIWIRNAIVRGFSRL